MNKEEQKAIYDEVVKIYDFTELIIDAIELKSNKFPELQTEMFGPIVEKLQDAADIMTESYINFVETGQNPSRSEMLNIERIVRKAYIAVDVMLEKMAKLPHNDNK